ncbi:hypothetical protein M011DRAFT_471993 [Sporormia fimetaria CBS 119925]|uniref:Xylanolytic transcriptional activator regulatory domain-containing protein n=1 Tax=Sporormia fimetaria CBS 119925 TaxID=1340428 RepID=A0A6A6UWM7_9PLEO|nr:hypothetical protein M011DRAFT_471993 [Sporormia fimetaria CBS 119925]
MDGRPAKRARVASGDAATGDHGLPARTLQKAGTAPSASIMLAPHVAEDVDILQRHISQHRTSEGEDPQSYQTVSRDMRNPIVYLSVPRQRTGLHPGIGPGKEQLEIIEHLMGPFKREVIDLYFQYIHPHLPILDDETCALIRHGPVEQVPKNLMCCIYGHGALQWMDSDTLKLHPRPDHHYLWNKAISAVLEDFLSPSLATISSAVLDQIGRPSVSIMNNATLCGRNVALAQTFGLHRDPSKWDMSEDEKLSRKRIWWGVLITDYWSSIAYGAPPHIHKGFYDVPLPSVSALIPAKASPIHRHATTCFVHLCALTELLGDILSLVHRLKPDPADFYRTIEARRTSLTDLESSLPDFDSLPPGSGSSNLYFCLLSVKLLLSRVALRAAVLLNDTNLEKLRLDEVRTAASSLLDFVLSLREPQFQDFWLPYATYLLVNAVMVSLRCTVENAHAGVRQAEFKRLQAVMAHIQHAHDHYDWDIAKYCLERCKDSVTKIASYATRDANAAAAAGMGMQHANAQATDAEQLPTSVIRDMRVHPDSHGHSHGDGVGNGNEANTTHSGPNLPTTAGAVAPIGGTGLIEDNGFALAEFFDPNAFDFSWEALWDTPAGMTFTTEFS